MPENWKSFIDINDDKVSLSKLLRDELLKNTCKPTEELAVSENFFALLFSQYFTFMLSIY